MTNKKLKMAAMSVALTACVAASPLAAKADAPEAAPAGIGLIEGFAKLIIQPEVARIGTGSGSSDNTLDRDNEKNRQRKGGRRR